MNKLKTASMSVLSGILLVPCLGFSASSSTLNIVNYYGRTLTFKQMPNITTSSDRFVVKPNTSKQLVMKKSTQPQEEYIRGEANRLWPWPLTWSKPSVFFSPALDSGTITIHGYVGSNIAYSWKGGMHATITFCKPADYTKLHCHKTLNP